MLSLRLERLSAAGARDAALCRRVARKVLLAEEAVGPAARALAAQGHRDVELFRRLAELADDEALPEVLGAMERLGIEPDA